MSRFNEAMNALQRPLDDSNLASSGVDTGGIGIDVARQAKQAANSGPPPVYEAVLPPAFLNRMGYIHLHEQERSLPDQHKKNQRGNGRMFRSTQTMRPHVQHGPAPSIRSLRAITLREVAKQVNHIHEDRILFVKTIHAAHRIVGTNVLVEDDDRDCLMLSVYNCVPANEDPKDFFPEGSYLALLAPYMKNSGDDPNRNLLLRCDNPECVRFFSSRRSWLAAKHGKKFIDTRGLDPSHLRKEGNAAFTDDRYETAARLYLRALDCTSILGRDDKLACLSNLAEVRIRQELWEDAEKHAKAALELDITHTKAKFRLATAWIRLGKIKEAAQLVEERQEKIFRQLKKEISRLAEECDGHYDLVKMRREAATRPGDALSTFHSNYSSESIQRHAQIIKREDFLYRGTVATRAIQKNTLVSSSKAVIFSRQRNDGPLDCNIDPYSKSMLSGSVMELETKLILLLHRRPELRGNIYTLSSGLGHPNEGKGDSALKIDTKRIYGIVASNIFAASAEEEVDSAWKQYKRFQTGRPDFSEHEAMHHKSRSGSGLWVNESLFNHSCNPNCKWRQIGDQMFIWTTRDIDDGEELTLSYVEPEKSFQERQETFQNWIRPNVGFVCQCDWCHVMRGSSDLQYTEKKVHAAYREAAKLVSSRSIKMAIAAEQVIPREDREACFKIFSEVPLALQHFAGAKLWVMEGACLAHAGDVEGALVAYELAAEINYAVRGGFGLGRAKDLWRIVGASMACGQETKAFTVLSSIYQDFLSKFSLGDQLDIVFHDLTLNNSLPWWHDSYDVQRQRAMQEMIAKVVSVGNKSAKKLRKTGKK